MTTSDYLEQLTQDRDDLVDNLETKGITGLTGDETFTELVPEVLNIPSGVDLSEYFDTSNITVTRSTSVGKWVHGLKKIKYTNDLPNNDVYELFKNFTGEEIDVSEFVLKSQNTSMQQMFSSEYIKRITGIENLNLSNVTNIFSCFNYCLLLESLNVKNWNTSNITDMSNCFGKCQSLTNLDLSNWNTSNVSNMATMFGQCANLLTLDISSFTTKSNVNCEAMFYGSTSLQKIDMRNFVFSNIGTYTNMFGMVSSGTNYKIPANCLIIVKDNTEKAWINTNFSWLTNVQTVAEYEASLNS